jgi:hypothetical protein
MKTAAPALALVLALAVSVPASAACTYGGEPSLCDPALPGVILAPELARVQLDSLELQEEDGRWVATLALSTTAHPGEVRIAAWRYGITDSRTWVAPLGSARQTTIVKVDVGPGVQESHLTTYGAHGLTIEWDADGSTWGRHVWLHRGTDYLVTVPGNYYLTAGEGSVLPWWVRE